MDLKVSPLNDLNQLLSFKKNSYPEEIFKADNLNLKTKTKETSQMGTAENSSNKQLNRDLLICHDFKGNYRNDAKIYNSTDENLEFFIPQEYLENKITEFVYFAHHFVTIPPCGWINLCHCGVGLVFIGIFGDTYMN